MKLPTPDCPFGFTETQIAEIMGSNLNKFSKWMAGQTTTICEGKQYNHETKQYEPTQCANHPHGYVTYPWDVEQFIKGGNPLD